MKDLLRYTVLAGVFVLPFLPLMVTNSLFFPYITGKNFTFRILVEIMFAAWIGLACYEPKYRPRFSYIFVALLAWLVAVFVADVHGMNPAKSLWSNYERMEGFVSIAHLVLYVFVAGSVLNAEKLWNYFFNTTIIAASLVSFYAFAQLAGAIPINQGGDRIDATLGNSAYLAIYMLFHVFIAVLMAFRSKSGGAKAMYGVLALVFAGLLFDTATRGTILGLVGGAGVTVLYMLLFGGQKGMVRKWTLGALIALVVAVGAFWSVRHQPFIQHNPTLERIANISLAAGETRFIIWHLAWEGFKERPVFGWGQENFNYVFNKYYDARLTGEEPWFDRVHDIFFDWLIAGGVVGLVTYFSIYFSALFYVAIWPRLKRARAEAVPSFTPAEQAILLGLLAGYMFHNVFVFDNVVSYMFYATILAFIHSRVASEMPRLSELSISRPITENIVLPVAGVALVAVIYFVNVPSLLASSDLIHAFQSVPQSAATTADYDASYDQFQIALNRGGFGDQEIREQMTRIAEQAIQDPQAADATKKKFADETEKQLLAQVAESPEDARVRVFISSFYRVEGNPKAAIDQLNEGIKLSPEKQQVWLELALANYQSGDTQAMLDAFKKAYELAPRYGSSRLFYAAGALYAGNMDLYNQLVSEETPANVYSNDFLLRSAYETKHYDIVKDILQHRLDASDPKNNLQERVSMAVAYHESGDTPKAIEILQQAIADYPGFKAQGEQYISTLKAGKQPQ